MTGGSGMQINKSEIEECQEIVTNFRVHELHLLLTSYHYPKLGKKQDLVHRAKSILSNPKYQLSAVQKVREIQASNRIRNVVGAAAPYLAPSSSQSDLAAMRRQQMMQNQAVVNRNNMMPSAASSYFHNAPHSNTFPSNNVFNNFVHGMPGFGGTFPNSASSSGSLARNLRIVTLPFYDVKSTLVPMTELPAFNIQPRPGEARHQCIFALAIEDIQKLFYKSDEQPLPRFEIQLRMFQLDTTAEQPDAFPPGCMIKLDDYNVTLPNIIPTNKPNAEQRRMSRPVNLTPYCQPPRGRERPHRMIIEWNGDKRAWAFTIFIVFRLNSNILQERLLQNVNARRSFENTKAIIVKRLNGSDDDGIEMDTLKISLLCPLMRTRIKRPARAIDCTHLQCFDLTNYLMMCEKRPVWKCPVCDNQALYSKLIIDEYFQRMVNTTSPAVDEVELLRDGTWRTVKEDVMDLSDDDDDDVVVASSKNKKSSSAAPSSMPPSVKNELKDSMPNSVSTTVSRDLPGGCDVITLSDSDDDDDSSRDAVATAALRMVSNPNSNAGATPGGGNGDSTSKKQPEASANNNNYRSSHSSSSSNDNADSSGYQQQNSYREGRGTNDNNDDMDSSDSIICLDSDDLNGFEGSGTAPPAIVNHRGSSNSVSSLPTLNNKLDGAGRGGSASSLPNNNQQDTENRIFDVVILDD